MTAPLQHNDKNANGNSGFSLRKIFKFLRGIRFLPPHDKIFYHKFNEFADNLIRASQLLKEMFSDHSKVKENAQALRLLEKACDSLVGQIVELLDDAQQPPYDPDYISELAHQLDEIMANIERAGSRFELYEFPSSEPAMKSLADGIERSCHILAQIIRLLPKRSGIDALCREIHDIETVSDEIHHQALAERIAKIRNDQQVADGRLTAITEERIAQATPEEMRALLKELYLVDRTNRDYLRHVWLVGFIRDIWRALEHVTDTAERTTVTLKKMVRSNG